MQWMGKNRKIGDGHKKEAIFLRRIGKYFALKAGTDALCLNAGRF